MLRLDDPAESETMGVLNFPMGVLNFPIGLKVGFDCVRIGSIGFEAPWYQFVSALEFHPRLNKSVQKRVFSHASIG